MSNIFPKLACKTPNISLSRYAFIVFDKVDMTELIRISYFEEYLNAGRWNVKSSRRESIITSESIDFSYQTVAVTKKEKDNSVFASLFVSLQGF